MFGQNEIVGKRAFPDDNKLLITSIFVTLQGEGPYSGLPAVFVRLAKCNLACSFCDTYFDSGEWLAFDELDKRIDDELWDSSLDKSRYVLVVTGGEPMLQKALGPWLQTQFEGGNKWRNVQIETNGTAFQPIHDGVTVVVSPKCSEKNGVAKKYLNPRPEMMMRADVLKFVMNADESSPYSTVPTWALDWRKETGGEIYVSPMNYYSREPQKAKIARNANETTIEQRSQVEEVISFWEPGLLDLVLNEKSHRHAASYAINNDLRFQVQAHLYAGVA